MKKTSRTQRPLTDVLKQAIADSGLPHLTIANEAGIARASLIRFMANETSIRLDIADKLAAYFGLTLTTRKGKK